MAPRPDMGTPWGSLNSRALALPWEWLQCHMPELFYHSSSESQGTSLLRVEWCPADAPPAWCCPALQLHIGKPHLQEENHSLCCFPPELQIRAEGRWSTWKETSDFYQHVFWPVAETWFNKSYREVSTSWALLLFQVHVSGFEINAFTLCRGKIKPYSLVWLHR